METRHEWICVEHKLRLLHREEEVEGVKHPALQPLIT
jgi:hypothetical protein